MFRSDLDFEIHSHSSDDQGRYIVLDLSIYSQRMTFVCLYGYNKDEPSLFQDIFGKIISYSNTCVIMCGDWNVVQDPYLDNFNILHNRNPNAREKIKEIVSTFEMIDPWRTCHPDDRKYTWRQSSPIKQSRLDYFLITEDLFSLMKNVSIIPGYKTDHSAIIFTFSASLEKRGKGYWKFNSQLLRDLEYIEKVKICIKDTITEYYTSGDLENLISVKLSCNDQLFFEILKMKIRSMSIEYSISKSRKEKDRYKKLETDIQNLENAMNMTPNDLILKSLQDKKIELENARMQKIEGLLLRSRANWHENGEKCSQYFCKLEKKNYIKKTITELVNDEGKHLSKQSDILLEQKKFYNNLYLSRNTDCGDNSFFDHNVRLTEEQKEFCEGNLTLNECSKALQLMQNGKSPGSDGFTVDFYKFFWKDIGVFLFRSLYYGYENRQFSQFQCQGVITCIPKEGKDRRYLNNWRPISLLNTDVKIASAVIANRIKQVLPFIISDTQKGFMKDRFIGENTRLLYDLMHYLEENNKTGLLLLIDFEKAFDSIEWTFLKKALNSFNFGPSVCTWFDTFYRNASSSVINNGHLSEFFSLERGCRQGDPLSPYLFIIGVELLSMKIKSNSNIKGVLSQDDKESLISQYADDTFLMLDGSEFSLRESLKCFENFHAVSGLKMNLSKTRAVWVGNRKYSDLVLCPEKNLSWSHSNFKLLGIEFSLDLDSITELNFSKKIKEVSGILKSWQHRKLTLMGKITVVKSLALPKLIHLLTALPNLPRKRLVDLNSMFFNFIWDGKPDKIKRSTLIGDFSQGGLRMIHLESFNTYLKLGWIKRYLSNLDGNWQTLLNHNLKPYGGERSIYLQKEKLKDISMNLKNLFWKDVFSCLSDAKPYTKHTIEEIFSLDILNFSPIADFPYYSSWKSRGVQFLKDIIDLQSKDFCDFNHIKNKLDITNFLKYYSLIAAIPKDIKQFVRQNLQIDNLNIICGADKFSLRIVNSKKPKFIYNDLVNKIVQLPLKKIEKWEESLGVEISNMEGLFNILKSSCKDSYHYNFQYKFLHRIIPTNNFLYKIKLKDTQLCCFCKTDIETVEHLFYDCRITQQFWDSFIRKLKNFFHNVIFDKEKLLLGFVKETPLLNLLVIITKKYIYKCKLNETLPSIIGLQCKIEHYRLCEHQIALKRNTVTKFESFWNPLSSIFTQN